MDVALLETSGFAGEGDASAGFGIGIGLLTDLYCGCISILEGGDGLVILVINAVLVLSNRFLRLSFSACNFFDCCSNSLNFFCI